MSPSLRRDLIAGASAGLAGLPSTGTGVALEILAAILIGAGYGATFRYQPFAYAATISNGVLYGLLWWIAGPLTLAPLLLGRGPGWSLQEADAALPSLVGHVLYGALTGLSFYVLVSLYRRARPGAEVVAEPPAAPTRRVVILGGGFGGVSTAQRLEQLFARDPHLEIALVSQSNYLLFTPMLAEVASSGLEASMGVKRR